MSEIFVVAETLPEAWENAVLECWNKGTQKKTEYDKSEDPPSRDCAALIVIKNPLAEPRIHRCFPGGLEDLYTYKEEVVYGVHDHWIDPDAGKWSYTYSQRLTKYPANGIEYVLNKKDYLDIPQLAIMTLKLKEAPHSRRAQAITWVPIVDQRDIHPPCLQRVWCTVVDDKLDMHIHIRSNDAYKAGFMNMYAFIALQEHIAMILSHEIEREIGVGVYRHFADSWHIYGSYFEEFEGFRKTVLERKFEERVWSSDDPIVLGAFEDAQEKLFKENKEAAEKLAKENK